MRSIKKRWKCFMNALSCWKSTGIYVDHVYGFTYEPAIIVTSKHCVRVSDNYIHTPDEVLYKNACLIQGECRYCGRKLIDWYKNYDDVVEKVKEIPMLRDTKYENNNLEEESSQFWNTIEYAFACECLKNSGEYLPLNMSRERRKKMRLTSTIF